MLQKFIHIYFAPVRMILILACSFLLQPKFTLAQCAGAVSAYPYTADFETSNDGWVPGGSQSDWAWGKPVKPVINSAASGSKCWITGGLTKSAYNDGQKSWLKSPCFNFTTLKNPYIICKVFWETEFGLDGANLEYSTDNGISWQIAGDIRDASTCNTENWYNASVLPGLANQNGWSGNTQSSRPGCFLGGGSISWITVKHSLPMLAGLPNVLFRFVFASGAGCNNFDGFAIDDFTVQESPANQASFTYKCSSSLRVNFTSTASPCTSSYLWNFDDTASGADNTSTLPNPTHAYTAGGNYKVRLTVNGPGNTSSTVELPGFEIYKDVVATIVTPLRCNGDSTGSATVNFSGGSSFYNYSWDTKPVQTTKTAENLHAGFYNVTISSGIGCPASANILLTEPPPIVPSYSIVKPNCTLSNGSIAIAVAGGVAPYNFRWQPNVSSAATASNLPSGMYTVTISDKNGCSKVLRINLPGLSNLEATANTTKNVSCFGGNDGAAILMATGGKTPYQFTWPTGETTAALVNLAAGSYAAIVTDAEGCQAFATALIEQPDKLASFMQTKQTSCGLANGSAEISIQGGTSPFQIQWSPGIFNTASISSLAPGSYVASITDQHGCILLDTATIQPSDAVTVQLTHTNVLCAGKQTGTANAMVSGGTLPYISSWKKDSTLYTDSMMQHAGAGNYLFTVKDAVGCSVQQAFTISEPTALHVETNTTPSYCHFNNAGANAVVTGGVAPYSYLWSLQNSTSDYITNVTSGNYQLTVTDSNHCIVNTVAPIANIDPPPIFIGNDTTLCPGNSITLKPGNFSAYRWQNNATDPQLTITQSGIYMVHVTDNLGCVISDTIHITGDCGLIFFPTAFTPNNDRLNDFFGPVGILTTVQDYSLLVFSRNGQLVFKSNNPFAKWDGKMPNSNIAPGTYVWIARFSNKGEKNLVQKGTVTVIY